MAMLAGMSCPSIYARRMGARRRCVKASGALDAQRAAELEVADGGENAVEQGGGSGVALELDPELIVDGSSGRRGWPREARRQTDQQRKREAWPVPRERLARLLEAERRLSQDLAVEVEANRAYYAYRAGGRMRDGRRFGKPPAVWVAPEGQQARST